MISKADVVSKMQTLVEDFDFEQVYRNSDGHDGGKSKDEGGSKDKNKDKKPGDKNEKAKESTDSQGRKVLVQCNEEYLGMVAFASKVYELKNR